MADLRMDAARGASESPASAQGDEEDERVGIAQVYRVTFGNKAWYPDIQFANNRVYFKIDKHDRELHQNHPWKGYQPAQEQG